MNNFNVPTAVPGIMQGMQTFIQGDQERQQQTAQQNALQEGAKLLQSGTPDQVAQWNLKNPGLSQQFIKAGDIQDKFTEKPLIEMSKGVLSGQMSAKDAIAERVGQIEAAGGTAPRLREMLEKGDDNEIQKYMENTLALYQPGAFQSYIKANSASQKKGFTLSEGQGRYDEEGNLMAYMPKTVDNLDKEIKREKSQFDKASKIRSEVEKVSKVYRDVEDSFGRIEAAVTGAPSGATDMALIFNYMKMLDPGSTVREGEFATAANTGGLPATVVNLYNSAKDGQMLTSKQRNNFISQAKEQFNSATVSQNKRLDEYEKLGSRYGLDRGDVIVSETKQETVDPVVFTNAQYGDVTEDDIQETMRANGLTRDEVLARLQGG